MLEPGDTTARTSNLQQTNTNGYKFQGTPEQLKEAQELVGKWGSEGEEYRPTAEYQELLSKLIARFPYRLDTNFAKMDRIVHTEIEAFKEHVYKTEFHGRSIGAWNRLISKGDDSVVRRALAELFNIRDDGQPVVK